ncbi:hypothetical protein, partial [Kitasatospora sp. NPDC058190]|uniref:hypothetical protein n=1 Tax=Kitasatospora sp. NPDC058190 TaxID=3346371 RepID=UPI0036DAA08D
MTSNIVVVAGAVWWFCATGCGGAGRTWNTGCAEGVGPSGLGRAGLGAAGLGTTAGGGAWGAGAAGAGAAGAGAGGG